MNQKQIFKKIIAFSKKTSTNVFVVGGFVRDRLLYGPDYEGKDIDFVVLGSGLEFAKGFDVYMKEAGSLVEFPDFDTARYIFVTEDDEGKEIERMEIEFAGARSEVYEEDSRKPAVSAATLETDLSRRDFTVNAMALPIALFAKKVSDKSILEHLIDPYDGKNDLQEKLLRTPLEPEQTFSDDPLRMMRAARFAAQLNFEIEKKTYAAIKKHAKRLSIISAERVQEELFKLLGTQKPAHGLQILHDTSLFDQFLPEVTALGGVEEVAGYQHKDNLSHTFAVVENIAEYTGKPLLRFAALMHDIAKPQTKKLIKGRGWTFDMHEHLGKKMVRDIGKRLRMKKQDIEYVANLVRWHLQPIALMDKGVTDSAVRRLIVNLQDDLEDLLMLCKSDITTGNQKKKARRLKNYDYLETRVEEVLEKDQLRAFQSPVRGEEIMELCGLKPGPTVGKIKSAIEEAILDGVIPNEYDAAKEHFEKIKDQFLEEVEDWEKTEK